MDFFKTILYIAHTHTQLIVNVLCLKTVREIVLTIIQFICRIYICYFIVIYLYGTERKRKYINITSTRSKLNK